MSSVRFDIQPGREGVVDFRSGQESVVYRAKNGHLTVVIIYFFPRNDLSVRKKKKKHQSNAPFIQRPL